MSNLTEHGWKATIRVDRSPVSMGSKSACNVRHRDGSLVLNAKGNPKVAVFDVKSDTLRAWQMDIRKELSRVQPREPSLLPFAVILIIYLARPKGHYRTGKFANQLKSDAPTFAARTPDADKVLRAACDVGTRMIYQDDGQVVLPIVYKMWTAKNERTILHFRELKSRQDIGPLMDPFVLADDHTEGISW